MTDLLKWKNDIKNQWDKYDFEDENHKFYNFLYLYYFLDGSNPEDELDRNFIIEDDCVDFICKDKEDDLCFVKFVNRNDILDENKYEKIIKKIFSNHIKDTENEKNTSIKLYFMMDEDNRVINKDKIIEKYKNLVFSDENISYDIIDLSDLKNVINKNLKKELYIPYGELEIDKEKNILYFDNNENNLVNKAIVCNISAKSLKTLYDEHGNQLLNLNLRYFKKKKDVDEKIKSSILEKPAEFWYLNNGIYIISDKFRVEKNKLFLEKFSIINGGQTTYNIANTDLKKDFYLICKIISIDDWSSNNQKETYDFANRISISSNQQKPIKSSDLISNMPEVTVVKDKFRKFNNWRTKDNKPIFITSKIGEFENLKESNKELYDKKSISIELLLQLYSCWKGMPGLAKNKSKIYDQVDVKKALTDIANNVPLFANLIWLYRIFEKLKNISKKKDISEAKRNMYKYFNFYNISSFHIIFEFLKNWNKKGSYDFKDTYGESSDRKKFYEDFNFKINDEINDETFRDGFVKVLGAFESDLIKETLKHVYPGQDNFSQCHNLVKSDKGFDEYSYSFLKFLANNNESRDFFNKVFGFKNV